MRTGFWGILFLSLMVLFLFFAGFYGFIIPSNRASVNKYGFHILEQLEKAIQNKIDADLETYANNLDSLGIDPDKVEGYLPSVRRRLHALGADTLLGEPARDISRPASPLATAMADSIQWMDPDAIRKAKNSGHSPVYRRLKDISNGKLIYEFRVKKWVFYVPQPITRLMENLRDVYPNDFYSSFVFLKCDRDTAVTLFKSEGVPIGLKIPTDSLLVHSKRAFYPGITDLNAAGTNVKLFYIPLTKDNLQFALCGVRDADAYDRSLRQVPARYVYPFIIVLILLAMALPLIKFYIIGPFEAIRVRDFAGMVLALLAGGMLITVACIQLILIKDSNLRQLKSLRRVSMDIDASFKAELRKAFNQMQSIDRQRAGDAFNWLPNKKGKFDTAGKKGYFDVSDSLIGFMRTANPGYFNFDRIAWVDSNGFQAVTGSLDPSQTSLHIDVSERQYFVDFINKTSYRLPGNDSAVISIQAVLTRTDGDFRVVLAGRSNCPKMMIISIAANLYSVNHTVLPAGFGFCIIDPEGGVQLHSDSSRNLVENFIEQSDEPDQLRTAIRGRQELYLENANLYGREYGLHLRPIANMPFYLAVFYDKGYSVPANIRILLFALAGCGVNLAGCLLVWLAWVLAIRRRWTSRPLIFAPLDFLVNLRPDRTKVAMYLASFLFLFAYVLTLVLVSLWAPYNAAVNYIILWLSALMPLVVMGILCFFWWRWLRRSRNERINAQVEAVDPEKTKLSGLGYLFPYLAVIEVLIFSLGVGPAALYSWHAQNQEILQSVKREQLLEADHLAGRQPALRRIFSRLDTSLHTDRLSSWWIDSVGIYTLYKQRRAWTAAYGSKAARSFAFEEAYFNEAQRLDKVNHDPGYMPILKSRSEDSKWRWLRPEADTLTFIFAENPEQCQMVIRSSLPERYPYLGFFWKSFCLSLLIIGLVMGLYGLIRRIAREVFMTGWTKGGPGLRERDTGTIKDSAGRILLTELPFANDFVRYIEGAPVQLEKMVKILGLDVPENWRRPTVDSRVSPMLLQCLLIRLNSIDPNFRGGFWHEGLDEIERMVVRAASVGEIYFAWLFTTRITDKEKWLLYNFACHGLLNYKNLREIDCLLEAKVLDGRDGQVRIFNPAFRAYILLNWREDQLPRVGAGKSAWQKFRTPFLILLTVALAFVFLTQQEAWQRMTALVGALGTALGAIFGLFKNFSSPGEAAPAASEKEK